MVTLKDIAARAGLSVSSVSLVLRGKETRLSEESRKRILDAAREMNYRPNQLAAGLSGQRSNTIGLIVPDIHNSFFAELAQGVISTAQDYNYTVLLNTTGADYLGVREQLEILASRKADAIIMGTAPADSPTDAADFVDFSQKIGIPMVMVDRYSMQRGGASVSLDHYRGACMATEHLFSLGHKRILHISGPQNAYSAEERRRGFEDTMRKYGITDLTDCILKGDYSWEAGYKAVDEILQRNCTAVFAANDMIAFGVYRGLRERGIQIPQDISLIGFDDILFSEFLEVPLTTIRQSACEIGKEAALQALQLVKYGDVPGKFICLEPQLVVRASTGAPPKEVRT